MINLQISWTLIKKWQFLVQNTYQTSIRGGKYVNDHKASWDNNRRSIPINIKTKHPFHQIIFILCASSCLINFNSMDNCVFICVLEMDIIFTELIQDPHRCIKLSQKYISVPNKYTSNEEEKFHEKFFIAIKNFFKYQGQALFYNKMSILR